MTKTYRPEPTETAASKWWTELSTSRLFDRLYSRWLDEHEYEEISEYGDVLAESAAAFGLKIEKMTKRPFGCRFVDPTTGAVYVLKRTLRYASYERIA